MFFIDDEKEGEIEVPIIFCEGAVNKEAIRDWLHSL